MSKAFDIWWADQIKGSNQWSTLERLVAKDAWRASEREITAENKQLRQELQKCRDNECGCLDCVDWELLT